MLCKKCGSDKFDRIEVIRGKRYDVVNSRWFYTDSHDTRIVLCDGCGTKFLEESKITHVFVYNETKMRLDKKTIDDWKPDNSDTSVQNNLFK